MDATDTVIPLTFIAVAERSGRLVFLNQALCQLTGLSNTQIAQQDIAVWTCISAPEDHGVCQAYFESADEDSHLTLALPGTSGRQCLVKWWRASFSSDDSRYFIASGIDITEQEHLRQQLIERKAHHRAVFDNVVDTIIVIDEAGTIETVNPAIKSMFGYTSEELLGQPVTMLMPESHRMHHDEHIRRFINTGEARVIGIGREVEGLHKNGSRIPIDLAISEVVLADRRVFTGILRDASHRHQLQAQVHRHLEEYAHTARLLELGEMASGLAHEIAQPLTAIVSFSQACLRLLRTGGDHHDALEQSLTHIAAQGARAGDIVQRLKDSARKNANAYSPVSITACVKSITSLLAHELRRNQVRVHLDLAPALPPCSADQVQLEQVLVNLVRNANDAMADVAGERCLTIRAHTIEDHLRVSVEDTGTGVNIDGAEQTFERFFTTKAHGVGVGLSISRAIVEAHGGRIWAANQVPTGAVFSFELPVMSEGKS